MTVADPWLMKFWACDRYACEGLPLHQHVQRPLPPRPGNPYAATHIDGPDIERIWVDWRAVAYEATTGRRLLPPEGQQLTLDDVPVQAHG